MRFTLTKEIDQCALGLRVQICDFGDHNGLDLRAGQDCGRRLRHIGLHNHDLHVRIIELMLELSLGIEGLVFTTTMPARKAPKHTTRYWIRFGI